jgi:hypothetical protein
MVIGICDYILKYDLLIDTIKNNNKLKEFLIFKLLNLSLSHISEEVIIDKLSLIFNKLYDIDNLTDFNNLLKFNFPMPYNIIFCNFIISNAIKFSQYYESYDDFIKELFNHLTRMNENIKNENFEKYIYYLKKYLIHDKELSLELKPYIENKLSDLYINFNQKQKKENREIKINLEEKIEEYKKYRTNECRLHNGYNPEIINSTLN